MIELSVSGVSGKGIAEFSTLRLDIPKHILLYYPYARGQDLYRDALYALRPVLTRRKV